MATQVGVTGATLTIDPNTGNGTLMATMHNPDGSTSSFGPIHLTAGQIALAKEVIPQAATVLQTNLTAQGGVAQDSDVAALFSFVLAIARMDANAQPTVVTGPDVLADVG